MMQTEILPVACRLVPGFSTHVLAQNLLSNRELLRSLVSGKFTESSKLRELAEQLSSPPSRLYQLAAARMDWSDVGDRVFVDRPDILTRHLSLAASENTFKVRDATDIVSNEIGVDLSVRDAFAIRLAQGVFDTNAESLVHAASSAVASTAEAFVDARNWVALTSPSDAQSASLSFADDVRHAIADDLAAGYIVVVPKTPVALKSGPFVGWWRVDPQTGHALGVDRTGWGVAFIEYAKTVAMGAGIGYVFGYAQCVADAYSAPPVASNAATDGIVASHRRSPPVTANSIVDYLVPPVEALGNSGCLWAAIIGGILGGILALIPAPGSGPGSGRPPIFGNGGGGGAGGGPASGGGGPAAGGAGGGGSGPGGGGGGPAGSGGTGGGGAGAPEGPAGAPRISPDAESVAPPGNGNAPGESAPAQTPPRSSAPTVDDVEAARQAAVEADNANTKATQDFVRYNSSAEHGGDPSTYDQNVSDQMYKDANAAERADTIARNRYNDAYNGYKNANNGAPPPRPIGPAPTGGQEVDPFTKTAVDPFGKTEPQGATPPANTPPCPAPPCAASGLSKSIAGQMGVANVLKGGS